MQSSNWLLIFNGNSKYTEMWQYLFYLENTHYETHICIFTRFHINNYTKQISQLKALCV